jgi:hypothetical protein
MPSPRALSVTAAQEEPVAVLDEKWFRVDGGVVDSQQGNQREITKEGL